MLQGPRRRWLLFGLAAMIAAALAVPALAQSSEDATAPSEATSEDGGTTSRDDLRSAFAAALADELGLSTERVEDALDNVRERLMQERADEHHAMLEERLDEAVADGDLTQEQADAILDAAEAGVLGREGPRGFGRRGGGPMGHHGFGGGWDDGATQDAAPSEDAA